MSIRYSIKNIQNLTEPKRLNASVRKKNKITLPYFNNDII